MPLRILLADESTTIKKAFQLALSDLGAEIKSVPSGLDVMTVAIDFEPHIIFADVLLTKKSGYEVCREITTAPMTKNIPVVLMWSNFMVFNTALAQQAGYSERLEKPFDTTTLRQIVTKYYKATETHPLKDILDFPNIPEFAEEFTPVKLNVTNDSYPLDDSPTEVDSKNRIHIETESHGDFEEVVLVQSNAQRSKEQSKISHQIKNYLENSPSALNKIEKHVQNEMTSSKLSQRFDDNLIREEVRVMTEKICWQIIPDMAEKLIRAELEKLMKSIEKSI